MSSTFEISDYYIKEARRILTDNKGDFDGQISIPSKGKHILAILSRSDHDMIALGVIQFENNTYYIGLPK